MEPLGLDLPLRAVRNECLYWKADELPSNGRSNFKIIIVSDGDTDTDGSYIIPEYEYPGLVKVTPMVQAVNTLLCDQGKTSVIK